MIEGLVNALKETVKEVSSYKDFMPNFNEDLKSNSQSFEDADKPLGNKKETGEANDAKGCPLEGHGGTWDGERGNSNWYPDRDHIPESRYANPDGLTWGEILDKYGIDSIPFKDGKPDFSEVSKGTVEIDDFSSRRYGKGGNFDQATEKLAEERGCTKEEVKDWMKENKYTWHERSDCKTMEKVPNEVHGNVRHSGGVSEAKAHSKEQSSTEVN
ncbi:HNH endonuclease [Clostridium uliginosum]|uniref:A nuclease of the HNH/ENDO VII superfamily with conserved WHH n=1 Tax=Clostridium uliginosum TaxID=119641 RepID=A0A1I1NQ55_9CLOT|nr:HNH endonuclease [Clostridium uliginosum]SFC99657.1 A nuclease of the HNH/ENDO VII superfamily with conserved WHH [Clostridium uliginosum]